MFNADTLQLTYASRNPSQHLVWVTPPEMALRKTNSSVEENRSTALKLLASAKPDNDKKTPEYSSDYRQSYVKHL